MTIFNVGFTYLVFSFDLIFNKDIHPGRGTVIKCNKSVMNEIGKDVHYSFAKDTNLFINSFIIK